MVTERKSIVEVLKEYNKKHEDTVGSIADVLIEVEGLPTGNLALDHVLSVGGVPKGRIIELYGKPSSGKSTCALQVAANLQKEIIDTGSNDHILYLDFEHALDKKYTKNLGFDIDHPSVILSQPRTFEDGASLARDLIATGSIRLMIWDSVAEAQPRVLVDGEIDQYFVGTHAKLMSQFLKQINGLLFRTNCTALFLNHIQEKISMGAYSRPGAPTTTTPGGDALKFFASARIEFQQIKSVRKKRFNALTNSVEDVTVSSDVKAKVTKNKVGDPNRECVVRVHYGKGFDNFYTAVQILIGYKKLPSSAGYFYFDKEVAELAHEEMEISKTGRPNLHGEDTLQKFAETHPEWSARVIVMAKTVLNSASSEDTEFLESGSEEFLGGFSSLEELESTE